MRERTDSAMERQAAGESLGRDRLQVNFLFRTETLTESGSDQS